MRDQIEANINNPAKLEELYRKDAATFERAFREISAELEQTPAVEFWLARLDYQTKKEEKAGSNVSTFGYYDILFLIVAVLLGWAFLEIPSYAPIDDTFFTTRNFSLCVLPAIAIYWIWKRNVSKANIFGLAIIAAVSVTFVNLFPGRLETPGSSHTNETLLLCCLFLPIFLWIVMGFCLSNKEETITESFARHLAHSGEILVTSLLIGICWGILYGVTITLFGTVGIGLENFFNYFWSPVLVSTPLIAVILTESYPQATGSLILFLTRIFGIFALLMFVAFYFALVFSPGRSPLGSREFLVPFNVALVGAAALIFFALGNHHKAQLPRWFLIANALFGTISVLFAIIVIHFLASRALAGGITPNRLVALGIDIILGIQLTAVASQLFSLAMQKSTFETLRKAIVFPFYAYGAWSAFVLFVFPFIFHFR